MEVLKAILAALVGLLVIFACIAWAIAAVLGPLAIIKLCALCLLGYFYPRPPRGGRRALHSATSPSKAISIHALREEGDF